MIYNPSDINSDIFFEHLIFVLSLRINYCYSTILFLLITSCFTEKYEIPIDRNDVNVQNN